MLDKSREPNNKRRCRWLKVIKEEEVERNLEERRQRGVLENNCSIGGWNHFLKDFFFFFFAFVKCRWEEGSNSWRGIVEQRTTRSARHSVKFRFSRCSLLVLAARLGACFPRELVYTGYKALRRVDNYLILVLSWTRNLKIF